MSAFVDGPLKLEDPQCVLQVLIDFHDCSLVTASVAVIGCAKDRDHIPILTPVVPFHDQLMCSGNQRQAVIVVECF